MDSNIRQLLSAAQQYGVESEGSFLHQAYDQLKIAAETKPTSDGPLPFGQDLYVLCAEIAFQYGLVDITKECLKMFFMKTSPPNQFLCRAYLCQAQLLAPTSAEDSAQLDKAVVYLLKAISFAKENPRYHFLVYNASVLFWQFCRPFLKRGYRQHLSISLHSVVKALDDIDDKDYEWRAQLMIALIECHVDAGRVKEAAEVSKATAEFTKTNVPALYKQVLGLQIRHQLVDHSKLLKDIKHSGDLTAYYKLVKLRVSLEQKEASDLDVQGDKLLRQILMEDDTSRTNSALSGRKTATPVSVSEEVRLPRTNKRAPAVPTPAAAAPTQPETILSCTEPVYAVRSVVSKWRSLPSTPVSKWEKAPLLLELANLCVEYDQPDLVARCVDGMKNAHIKDKGMFLQIEFLECYLMVLKLREKQESYSKHSVEVRIQAINRLTEALMNATRYGDPNIIQAGCVTQWNLCLPLLQTNLREHCRKPLTLVAEALESIQSLLVLLRCQIHTELAKCEEDEEQIQVAMEHLKKALSLDDGGQYHERLETALHRLQLRAELYKPPASMEDQAAMIIEQARKSAESGTVRMKRSLLVKAGQALSPDAFLLVLESENEIKGGGGKGYQTIINQLGNRARHFQKCIKKCGGHIKRLGSERDRERARLWADLAKVARKQEVWDVCRVAARFTLLYDDDRWHMVRPSTGRSDTRNESITSGQPEQVETPTKSRKTGSEPPPHEVPTVTHSDKDLIRTLAEIHFLNAESLIHLLRSEGVSLNNEPVPPEDKSKHPKGYVPTKPEDDPDWITYRDWIKDLSDSITKGFLRASELGVQLNEPWVVCSAATYLWNYNNHLLSGDRHRELVACYGSLLQDLKHVGHAGETTMLVNLCSALAYGLVQPWIPKSPAREVAPPPSPSPKGRGEKESPRKAKSVTSHTSAKTKSLTVDPDGLDDIKKALEVCEYAMEVTNGTRPMDIVPISVRHPLIIIWTRVKQLLGQQVAKSLGTEDENNFEGQRPLTRALVALEMKALNGNGLTDFKETPPLAEICNMVEECAWEDVLVELQVWTRLAELALSSRDHQLVMRATGKALEFSKGGIKSKKMDGHKTMVYNEMLSYSSRILGQSLIFNMQGKNAIRRSALDAFLNAARYGQKARNYGLVITAARLYWNGCLPLVNEPMERQLLKQPIMIVLDCVTATANKNMKKEEGTTVSNAAPPAGPTAKGNTSSPSPTSSPIAGILSDPEDDLTLRAALYGVMFQAYVDQGEWEEALAAMDKAVADMPRTKHRLLIFKHRLMVKAKLGRDVSVDIAKFKDESEDYLSTMWHKVALCSRDQREQLTSYKNAIEVLQASASDWQKVEYLMEFAEWLYINEFPLMDCLDQLEWAADILLNMKIETRAKVTEQATGKSKKKKGKKSAEPAPQSPAAPRSPTPTETKTATEGATDSEGEESKAARFIPIKKQSVIGLSASNLNLSAAELTSVKQLEHLVRIHTMLAKMAGWGSPMHKTYCLLAWGFLIRIWQVSLSSAGQVAKEMAKVSISNEQQGNQKNSAKGKPKKDGGSKGGKEQDTPREKPKRKGPLDAVPQHPEDWAMYDVPDEMREAFKEDHTGEGINKDSITKPTLTLYYLDCLVSELRGIGYSHLTFPALVFGEVVARDIVESNVTGNTYRLLSAEICLELNLTSAAKFHEASAGALGVSEDDLAKCREETARFKERQNQVRVEAQRARELQRLMTADEKLKKKPSRIIIPADQKTDIIESVLGLSKPLSGMTYRQAWTQQAEILTKQGYYQAARQLLSEAHLSTKAFDDRHTEVHILQNLAKLACQEANYGQAINLLKEAQKFDGNESFWLDTTVLLVDATLGDLEDRERNNKARAIILKALASYSEIASQRPNKKDMMTYIKATLDAKFASVQISQVLEESKDTMKPKAHRELQAACQRLQRSAEDFVRADYKREAAQVMQQHASILRLFACDSDDKEIQHSFLLQAQSIMQKGVQMMDHLLQDVCTLSAVQEMRSISLPLQRESCILKISYAELLIDMFVIYAEEQRQHQQVEAQKGEVEKLVEDFISATPVLTDIDKQWQKMASTFATGALSVLQSAHTLAGSIGQLKAKTLYNMGRCLRMLASSRGASPPSQWDLQYMNLTAGSGVGQGSQPVKNTEETEDGEEMHDGKDLDVSASQLIKYSSVAVNIKANQTSSELYLAQASEVLTQSVQLALQKGDRNLVAAGCLELVESCGQYDSAMTSQYLALYQSCMSSKCLEDLLLRAQRDPSTSKQAALLQQRQRLETDAATTNMGHGSLAKVVNENLQESSEAWKRIAVSPQHMDLIKEMPTNFNLVILQHSEDKSTLYGAILDRPKPAGGKEGGKPSKGSQSTASRAKVTRTLVEPHTLESLHRRFRQHKQDVMATLLKAEYQRSQQAQRQKMLENISDDMKEDIKDWSGDIEKAEDKLQEQFLELLRELEEYLKPILSYLDPAIRALETPGPAPTSRSDPATSATPEECVILLADKWLLEMPLEALTIFSSPAITSLSRDFSLQMLYHRIHKEPEEEVMSDDKKKKEAAKIKAAKDKAKGVKMVPIDRPVPPSCLPIDTHSFKYVVDPHYDCPGEEVSHPVYELQEALKLYNNQFSARWEGITGSDHVPSVGEWEEQFRECAAFIFYGLEKFFSHVPPQKLAPMNLTECQLVMILDLVQTSQSFMRQSKIDVQKSKNELSLEKSVETAMLLSLSGAGCIIENQWHCTKQQNANKFQTILKALLEIGRTTGQTVRRMFIPTWKQEGEEEEEGEGADDKNDGKTSVASQPQKANGSDSKGDKSKNAKAKGDEGGKSAKVKGEEGKSAKTKGKKEDKKESQVAEVKGQGSLTSVTSKEQLAGGEELELINRHWFNCVCYGLPNLMVTQVN
ncbi:cilia- and flagella-associated protein 46-like isoform X3 [Acanthaster planci]|uniref:Cilia- and flagella-associated protein 46-like isoform X3 n=1 Tax=Acanthaster planci TaxID=133434 RepID=A0A8B7YGW6_ACAPL|nr:cilia- and flagella-associated protein 46-like isoform X3 [Acanthaster planci]